MRRKIVLPCHLQKRKKSSDQGWQKTCEPQFMGPRDSTAMDWKIYRFPKILLLFPTVQRRRLEAR